MQAFWFLTLVVFMMVALFSLRTGLMLYLLSALIFPSLWFGEVALRFELVYCLWLLFVFFIRKSFLGFVFKWHPVLSRYVLFLIVIILSTILSLLSTGSEGSFVEIPIAFHGLLRPLLVMFLFLNVVLDERFVQRILWLFIWLSVPIGLLTLSQILGIGVAQEITLAGYTSPSRIPVFELIKEYGFILRATGVFESPVYNAIYLLIVAITNIYLLIKYKHTLKNRFFLYIALGVLVIAGIATLTVSFLIGIAIVLFLFIIFLWPKYPQRFLRFTISGFIIIGILLFIGLPKLLKIPIIAEALHYQVERMLEGDFLQTRYSPETGFLAPTYDVILQRPVLGWGLVQKKDVFVGDSVYVNVLYWGGGVGLAFLFFVVWSILRHSWRFRKEEDTFGDVKRLIFLYTLLLIALGIGAPSFWIPRLQEWYWAVIGIGLNSSLRVKKLVEVRN